MSSKSHSWWSSPNLDLQKWQANGTQTIPKDNERVLNRELQGSGDYWAQIPENHQLREEESHLCPQVLADLQERAKLWAMVLVTLRGCREWRWEPGVCSRLGVGAGPAIQPTTVLSSGQGRLPPQKVNGICSLKEPRSLKTGSAN